MECVVAIQNVVVAWFFLEREEQLAKLVRGANCVHKVVELAKNSIGSKKLVLLAWGRLCKLSFEAAHALAVQRRLNDEVYDMASTAYAVV